MEWPGFPSVGETGREKLRQGTPAWSHLPFDSGIFLSERNLLFAGGVIGGTGTGERGGLFVHAPWPNIQNRIYKIAGIMLNPPEAPACVACDQNRNYLLADADTNRYAPTNHQSIMNRHDGTGQTPKSASRGSITHRFHPFSFIIQPFQASLSPQPRFRPPVQRHPEKANSYQRWICIPVALTLCISTILANTYGQDAASQVTTPTNPSSAAPGILEPVPVETTSSKASASSPVDLKGENSSGSGLPATPVPFPHADPPLQHKEQLPLPHRSEDSSAGAELGIVHEAWFHFFGALAETIAVGATLLLALVVVRLEFLAHTLSAIEHSVAERFHNIDEHDEYHADTASDHFLNNRWKDPLK